MILSRCFVECNKRTIWTSLAAFAHIAERVREKSSWQNMKTMLCYHRRPKLTIRGIDQIWMIYVRVSSKTWLACVEGGIVGAREIKFWRRSRLKRMAKPREIPPARELGYFEYRPLLSPHWPQLIPINSIIQPIRADNFLTKYRRKGDRVTLCYCCVHGEQRKFAKGNTRTAS